MDKVQVKSRASHQGLSHGDLFVAFLERLTLYKQDCGGGHFVLAWRLLFKSEVIRKKIRSLGWQDGAVCKRVSQRA